MERKYFYSKVLGCNPLSKLDFDILFPVASFKLVFWIDSVKLTEFSVRLPEKPSAINKSIQEAKRNIAKSINEGLIHPELKGINPLKIRCKKC